MVPGFVVQSMSIDVIKPYPGHARRITRPSSGFADPGFQKALTSPVVLAVSGGSDDVLRSQTIGTIGQRPPAPGSDRCVR